MPPTPLRISTIGQTLSDLFAPSIFQTLSGFFRADLIVQTPSGQFEDSLTATLVFSHARDRRPLGNVKTQTMRAFRKEGMQGIPGEDQIAVVCRAALRIS